MKAINSLNQQAVEPLIQMAIQETAPNRIESDKEFAGRLRKSLYTSFHHFQKKIRMGIKILARSHTIRSPDRLKKIDNSLNRIEHWETSDNAITFQKIFHITDEEMAQFYQIGIDQLHGNCTEEASAIFLLLTTLNPKVSSFWLALGLAEEKRGEMEEATKGYLLAGELDKNNIRPYVYAAECLIALRHAEQAKEVLKRALERSENNPLLEKEKIRVREILNQIRN